MTCSPLQEQLLRWPWLHATSVVLLLLTLGVSVGVLVGMLMRTYIDKFFDWMLGPADSRKKKLATVVEDASKPKLVEQSPDLCVALRTRVLSDAEMNEAVRQGVSLVCKIAGSRAPSQADIDRLREFNDGQIEQFKLRHCGTADANHVLKVGEIPG